jgi:hypothetical protein
LLFFIVFIIVHENTFHLAMSQNLIIFFRPRWPVGLLWQLCVKLGVDYCFAEIDGLSAEGAVWLEPQSSQALSADDVVVAADREGSS